MKVNISGKAAVTRRANVFGPEENASHAQSKWLDFSNGPLATPGVSLFKRMIKKQRRSRSFTFGGGFHCFPKVSGTEKSKWERFLVMHRSETTLHQAADRRPFSLAGRMPAIVSARCRQ